MIHELTKLSYGLKHQGHTLAIPIEHLGVYYKEHLCECHYSDHWIDILIKVPLRPINKQFEIFEVIPIPVAFKNATLILTSPPSFVIKAGPLVFPLSMTAAHRCGLYHTSLCHLENHIISAMSADACTHYLISGGTTTDLDVCQYTKQQSTSLRITYVERDQVAITNPTEGMEILCDHESPQSIRMHKMNIASIIVNLPCHCRIKYNIKTNPHSEEEIIHEEFIHPSYPCITRHVSQFHLIPLKFARPHSFVHATTNISMLPAFHPNWERRNFTLEDFKGLSTLHDKILNNAQTMNSTSLIIDLVLFGLICILLFYIHRLLGVIHLSHNTRAMTLDDLITSGGIACHFPVYLEVFINIVCFLAFTLLIYGFTRAIRKPILNLTRKLKNSHRIKQRPCNKDEHIEIESFIQSQPTIPESREIPNKKSTMYRMNEKDDRFPQFELPAIEPPPPLQLENIMNLAQHRPIQETALPPLPALPFAGSWITINTASTEARPVISSTTGRGRPSSAKKSLPRINYNYFEKLYYFI